MKLRKAYYRYKLRANVLHFTKTVRMLMQKKDSKLYKWNPNAESKAERREPNIELLKAHLLAYFKGWKLRKIIQCDFVTNAKRSLNTFELHIRKLE